MLSMLYLSVRRTIARSAMTMGRWRFMQFYHETRECVRGSRRLKPRLRASLMARSAAAPLLVVASYRRSLYLRATKSAYAD